MQWYELMLWGLLGGFLIDGLAFYRAVQASNGRVPARYKRWGTWIAQAVRLVIGGGLVVALGRSGQVTTAAAAVAVGVAAPAILEKMSESVPKLP
jgi:hypothetical protein